MSLSEKAIYKIENYSTLLGGFPPLSKLEKAFNWLTIKLLNVSAILIALLLIPIFVDIILRMFGSSLFGVMDIETMSLVVIGFIVLAYSSVTRSQLQIDMVYNMLKPSTRMRLDLVIHGISFIATAVMSSFAYKTAGETLTTTTMISLPHNIFIYVTAFGIGLIGVASLFQIIHTVIALVMNKDYIGIITTVLIVITLAAAPFIYKFVGYKVSTLLIGLIGFILMLTMLLIKVPIGIAMISVGLLGLFSIMRTTVAVSTSVGEIPFRQASEFIFLAMPMFMLMGEMIFMSGISEELFDCANKWLGRLPGGLAIASVAGCAGFGAVSGDSMATVITMSSVALKPMRERNYANHLATGALAAGGTLGILIPPSMGFIVYSMLTQESVGKLFMAGIIPGILLTTIFCSIIFFQVKRNPSLAPIGHHYTISEKVKSLKGLISIIVIFIFVVGGIMSGFFTPGEGGAVGSILAILYAAIRKRLTISSLSQALVRTSIMCGKIFVILVGVFIFGVFLSASRLPLLLADFVVGLTMSKYIILLFILLIYVCIGCVMNVMPMMMLTLPAIFPTVIALGFDGVWFGVVSVIVMEMSLITPPVGANVFALASMAPDIPMTSMYKGILPFFFGMCLCVLLLVLFPQIALFLPSNF